MTDKKLPEEKTKELLNEDDLAKVSGGFSANESIRLEEGKPYYSNVYQYTPATTQTATQIPTVKDETTK